MEPGAYLRTHPPRCLAAFAVEVANEEELADIPHDELTPVFKVSCGCGHERFRAPGYRWRNPDTGAELFVSPLTLKCEACGKEALLFDVARHGYDAELGDCWSARGQGTPEPFACPTCGPASLRIYAGFEYPDDLFDDPNEFDARPQDFFTGFFAHGRCAGCGELVQIMDYECA